MIKLVFCLKRRDGYTREEFQRYWIEQHGPLVRSHAAALGIRKYVQVHSIDDAISLLVAGPRQSPPPFDGVAELWFDDLEAIGAAGSTEEGRVAAEALVADERTFVDLKHSPIFLAEEHLIVER
jgi:uncharacterized protein (TIGR02118 family)